MKFPIEEAVALARGSKRIMASKGKKLIEFADDATDEEIAKIICGRSGTLRAPAARVGDTFIVGFHAEAYGELFG